MKTMKNKLSIHRWIQYQILVFVLAIILSATACKNNSSGPDNSEPVPDGTYPLVQVDAITNLNGGGPGIPVTFFDGGGSELTFHEGSLMLQDDNRYDLSLVLQLNSLNTTISFEGTYSQNGDMLAFTDDDDPSDNFTASIEEGKIVVQSLSTAEVMFRLHFEIN